jgi:hypothetical protein
MRLVLDEDQSPEVSIVGDQDASFAKRYAKNFGIGQAGWVIARNSGHIVSERGQMRHKTRIGVLIEQEPHALAWAS